MGACGGFCSDLVSLGGFAGFLEETGEMAGRYCVGITSVLRRWIWRWGGVVYEGLRGRAVVIGERKRLLHGPRSYESPS